PDPDRQQLMNIGRQHFPAGNTERMGKIADIVLRLGKTARDQRRRPPGASEFLDAIRACESLDVQVSDEPGSVWSSLERAVIHKDTRS
ncbi:MAG: hypothetical protein KDB14_32940, partial [Planctomycetales bacterium]|nr:hypothetical protein [Planctomycetales bacterium]